MKSVGESIMLDCFCISSILYTYFTTKQTHFLGNLKWGAFVYINVGLPIQFLVQMGKLSIRKSGNEILP